jgi:hypothetical protein
MPLLGSLASGGFGRSSGGAGGGSSGGPVSLLIHGWDTASELNVLSSAITTMAPSKYPAITLTSTTRSNGAWTDITKPTYDVCFMFSNGSFSNSASSMNAFANAGGGIVTAQFSQSTGINGLDFNLTPVTFSGGQSGSPLSWQTGSSHPIAVGTAGANTTVGSWSITTSGVTASPTLQSGATSILSTDSRPFVIYKDHGTHRSVFLNFFPRNDFVNFASTPNCTLLMLNAILWAARKI